MSTTTVEFDKKVFELLSAAKSVFHRKKWVQGSEWARVKITVSGGEGGFRSAEKVVSSIRSVVVGTHTNSLGRVTNTLKRVFNKSVRNQVEAVCALGAVHLAAVEAGYSDHHDPVVVRVRQLLDDASPTSMVTTYNDEPGRKKSEVRAVFQKAWERAKAAAK